MPDKEELLDEQNLQSSHLPTGREIDESDTAYFDRRLSRADCALPDWDIPDAAYRPVPIVWFFSAWLAQTFGMLLAFAAVSAFGPYIITAVCSLLSGLISVWTWNRGMKFAGMGWKIATKLMLLVQLAFAALLAFA